MINIIQNNQQNYSVKYSTSTKIPRKNQHYLMFTVNSLIIPTKYTSIRYFWQDATLKNCGQSALKYKQWLQHDDNSGLTRKLLPVPEKKYLRKNWRDNYIISETTPESGRCHTSHYQRDLIGPFSLLDYKNLQ